MLITTLYILGTWGDVVQVPYMNEKLKESAL